MSTIAPLYRSESYSHRVAAEVRAHAARQGLMQKDLARALGYVPSQITKRVRGQVAFTLDELAVLADLFGIKPGELLPKPAPLTNSDWRRRVPGARPTLSLVPGTDRRLTRTPDRRLPRPARPVRIVPVAS